MEIVSLKLIVIMIFSVTFYDPLKEDGVDLGSLSDKQVMETFKKTDWLKHLKIHNATPESEVFYTPSLDVENPDTKHSLDISVIGELEEHEFYITYRRPKNRKIFGIFNKTDKKYTTDIESLSSSDAERLLMAFLKNDLELLEAEVK